MAYNIDHAPILNSAWSDEEAFREAMHQAGISYSDKLVADGRIHRFAMEKKAQKDGWYVSFGLARAFGDWRRDIHEKWSINKERLSDQDKERLKEQQVKAQQTADEARFQKH